MAKRIAGSKFCEEEDGPLSLPITSVERDCCVQWLEFAQRWLLLGTRPDYAAEEIQYRSEMLNGTRPLLWANLDIFKPLKQS